MNILGDMFATADAIWAIGIRPPNIDSFNTGHVEYLVVVRNMRSALRDDWRRIQNELKDAESASDSPRPSKDHDSQQSASSTQPADLNPSDC